ncbi:hypothetical protein CLF_103089 [Clonorchis sinensis]|uniref:Uncharacterized protein n=1 Tax=Clonorchis sinensis TaxID=79923 RepID=G7Y923_CLOSI|nr:hypothetical protein CLF_103089 [Clonorchis sinensis]
MVNYGQAIGLSMTVASSRLLTWKADYEAQRLGLNLERRHAVEVRVANRRVFCIVVDKRCGRGKNDTDTRGAPKASSLKAASVKDAFSSFLPNFVIDRTKRRTLKCPLNPAFQTFCDKSLVELEYAEIVLIFEEEGKAQVFLDELTKALLSFNLFGTSKAVVLDKCTPLNDGKYVHMSFEGDAANTFVVHGDNGPEDITRIDAKEDLGVWFSSDMSSSLHHAKSAQKAFAVLRMIRRNFSRITRMDFQILYGAYVRPLLECASRVV